MDGYTGRIHTTSSSDPLDRFRGQVYGRRVKPHQRDREDEVYEAAAALGKVQNEAEENRFSQQIILIADQMVLTGQRKLKTDFFDASVNAERCSLLFLLSQFYRVSNPMQLSLEYVYRFSDIEALGFSKTEMERTIYILLDKQIISITQNDKIEINPEWQNEIFYLQEA